MDGFINVFKPTGLTSARALDRVRRATGIRKSGHAGTLDPLADGVLIVCQGRGTKWVERTMDLPKGYHAVARLDVTSSSFDADRPLEPVPIARVPSAAEVAAALAQLVGEIQQVPPAVSAIKVGGQAAYKRERRGEALILAPKTVRIYDAAVVRYAWPALEFTVGCGRGTYIRALIRDLGAALQTGGCLTALRRTYVGPFTAEGAWTLERMADAKMEEYLIPLARVEEMLAAYRAT